MENNTAKPKRKTTTSTAVKWRYNSKTYSRIYANLHKELVSKFKETVKLKGTTTAAVLREAVERYINENEQKEV